MKVLFAASEAAPFAKVGGLADVVGSLPTELIKKGIEAYVIMPKHKCVSSYTAEFIGSINIKMGWRNQYAGLFTAKHEGVTFYFVDNEYYFGGDKIYGYSDGETEKYAFFSRAVIEFFPLMGFTPDIINLNDWQTGLIAFLLKTQYEGLNIKTVFTIHNLEFQGMCGFSMLKELLDVPEEYFNSEALEFYGGASFLKAGLLYSDKLATVSPTYREETLTPYFGQRMEGVLNMRKEDYSGILNGVGSEFDPENDTLIKYNYSANVLQNKARCKKSLRKELSLEDDANAPIIAIVSRLYSQKGLDLVKCVIHELLFSYNFQLVVLGTGEREFEDFFESLCNIYGGRVAVKLKYDNALAHRIYAGSDLFLMPSKYEPCGLSQLIAMKYGTLPIVRATGGLNDTVKDVESNGWGFRFENQNAHEMADAIKRALDFYKNKRAFSAARKRAMNADFSWNTSADEYIKIYKALTEVNE